MSIQASIMSMLSSTGQALAVPKAISSMNKSNTQAQAQAPKVSMSAPNTETSGDMHNPMLRVDNERLRKQVQKQMLEHIKNQFKAPMDAKKLGEGFKMEVGK